MSTTQREYTTLLERGRALVPYDGRGAYRDPANREGRPWLSHLDHMFTLALVSSVATLVATTLLLNPQTAERTGTASQHAVPSTPPRPLESGRYVSTPVTRGALKVRVAATGTVEPVRLVEVSTEMSGTIKAVHVENNDRVTAGQLLAELDSETLEIELARAKAQVAAARAKVREAEAQLTANSNELERKRTLARKDLATRRDLDAATAKLGQRQAEIEALTAELSFALANQNIAETNVRRARVLSPIDGVVLRRNVEPGQTVAASLQAPVLFRLAQNLDNMQIRVDIDEADALLVRPGQPATFVVQAMRNRQLEARVEKLFLGPEIIDGVVTYKALLNFDNTGLDLKPGMTASAEIVIAEIEGALLVPNAALRFSPPDATASTTASGAFSLVDTLLGGATPRIVAAAQDAPTPGPPASDDANATAMLGRVFVEDIRGLNAITVELGDTDGTLTEIVGGAITEGMPVVVDIAAGR